MASLQILSLNNHLSLFLVYTTNGKALTLMKLMISETSDQNSGPAVDSSMQFSHLK